MVVETKEVFSIDECLSNPDKLYVFGENEKQKGSHTMGAGQAIIRACPNSFGFCTLTGIRDYWTDEHFKHNCMRIDLDILELQGRSQKYEAIVFPKYGLGTGRANLTRSAPFTFLYLCKRLLEEFKFNNIQYLRPPEF